MAEIINLRQARKRAARGKAEAQADANRTAFGLPKEVRSLATAERRRQAEALDGKRRADADSASLDGAPSPAVMPPLADGQ